MQLTSIGRLRLVSFLTVGVLMAGGLGYGCSDDEETKPTPATTTDSGGGGDTGTTPDTGAKTDTGTGDTGTTTDTGTDAAAPTAVATITQTSDAGITGTATFVQNGATVTATVTLSGASDGQHGVHLHANPMCGELNGDGGPGTAAGGHWNPADASHGLPTETPHHLGDMGNITITGGTGTLTLTSTEWVVAPSTATNSVVGRAVIIHALVDQGADAQPIGAAGGRQACGVITAQ